MSDPTPPGARRSWLFLRGLTRGAGHWGDFPEIFAKLVPDDLVFFVDLPGNGEAFREVSPVKISDYVGPIREQARHKISDGRQGKLNVIAISMGAMITVEWMRKFPGEIAQAFLINTSAGNLSLPTDRFQILNFLNSQITNAASGKESQVMGVSANNPARALKFHESFATYSAAHPVSLANAFRQIFACTTFRFPTEPPGKIFLYASEQDRLVKFSCSQKIAQSWRLPLEAHPTAGHDLPLDDPQWLCEKILSAVTT